MFQFYIKYIIIELRNIINLMKKIKNLLNIVKKKI